MSGTKLVPLEPTDAMTFAGQQARYPATNSITVIYKAMLAAAPAEPALGGPVYAVMDGQIRTAIATLHENAEYTARQSIHGARVVACRLVPLNASAQDGPPPGDAERRMDKPSDCEVHAFDCGWRSALASRGEAPAALEDALQRAFVELGLVRPRYGAPGSRDVDVAAANKAISLARKAIYDAIRLLGSRVSPLAGEVSR